MASTSLSIMGWVGCKRGPGGRKMSSIRAQQAEVQPSELNLPLETEKEPVKVKGPAPQSLPPQPLAKSKNMGLEYGGDWLSSVTRHVRIYAAYINPETNAFDQTQMDKLTLILDPTNEFIWNTETTNKVYSYFLELIDHYEGADLTEYTLRLIGSDIEHYIRKMLYDGEIRYNMNARVLNFSMGKPRVVFNNDRETQDV